MPFATRPSPDIVVVGRGRRDAMVAKEFTASHSGCWRLDPSRQTYR
ncbi:MAG: hypothetical protein MZV64_09640 [Ignavibacteriales bacterium]|nr:hypothetical protein [Ignavibacteriales bacterium]